MPSTVKVKVLAARNLPVMDRLSYLTDAFVEIRLGSQSCKTEVARRTLNPCWSSDWYKFEVDDEELQEEALQIRVLDHDTYSSHDSIGRVYFDLNPLLDRDHHCGSISGWFPIYDTMHGIRGEIQLMVRVESFIDSNKYRQSSIGVKFFYSACLPVGYRLQSLLGFVEELVINDDPEYQWKEKIRTSRASNEARQRLFNKVNGELQRKLGRKVLDLGGNSVVGYQLHFDIEGQTGVVVRGIGTAALLAKNPASTGAAVCTPPVSPTANAGPKGFDFSPGADSAGLDPKTADTKGISRIFKLQSVPPAKTDPMTFVDFPFLTLASLPSGFLVHLGGVVAAKSVKLLDREEVESRDAWWTEIRTEIRSHMRSLGCQMVIGYCEEASIFEDVIVLSATGTAVTVNFQFEGADGTPDSCQVRAFPGAGDATEPLLGDEPSPQPLVLSLDRARFQRERSASSNANSETAEGSGPGPGSESPNVDRLSSSAGAALPEGARCIGVASQVSGGSDCALCHIPYNDGSAPFQMTLAPCGVCGRQRVPHVILASCEPPPALALVGFPALVQARVCRTKRENKGEAAAKEISDVLPFIEYEMYNQLVHKMKLKGMNAIFGLKIKISVGEDAIVSVATGTGHLVVALPVPQLPKLNTKEMDEPQLSALQATVNSYVMRNREFYRVDVSQQTPSESQATPAPESPGNHVLVEEESDAESVGSDLDLLGGAKETFVIEVDDMSAAELRQLLLDSLPPAGMRIATTEHLPPDDEPVADDPPGRAETAQRPPYLFARVWRSPLALEQNRELAYVMERFNKGTFFKLSRLAPCALSRLDYSVSITDDNQLQILLIGACLTLGEPRADEGRQQWKSCVLTPLTRPPGVTVESYLGNMDFFFVRETTNLREFENLSGFVHMCMAEVQSVVRAHATSIGANAVLSYHLSDAVLVDTPGRNQAQCLLNVCGDMARVVVE